MDATLVGRASLVVAVAVVLTAGACGGDDGSGATDGTSSAALVTSTSAVAASTPASSAPAPMASTSSAAATPVATAPPTTAAPATTTTTTTQVATASGADLRVDELAGTGGDAPGTPPWVHIESLKCDGPIGDWPLVVSGTRDMGAGLTLVLDGSGVATLAGTATAATGTFAADYTLDVEGVPLSTGGEIAHVEGTATFADGVLTLDGQVTGTSHGENPYRQVIMSMIPSTQVFVLTPATGTFC